MTAPIVGVTVLEDRASVTRRGKVRVRAGQQRIVIERVSPVLADKTLTATCAGARVLDIRCERYVAPWREGDDASAQPVALRAERVKLQAAHDAALATAQLARVESDGLGQLVAAASIVVITAINYAGIQQGNVANAVLTVAKVGGLAAIPLLALAFGQVDPQWIPAVPPDTAVATRSK